VSVRAKAARKVNALLERKHSWTDADVLTFTSLVRSDHTSNHAVNLTSAQLKDAELAVDKAFTDLTQAILERYHEEQVWSDKIRNVSTWAGALGLLINFVVFVGAIAVVEPWKRRRLVERLEERMTGMMEKVDSGVGLLAQRIDGLGSYQAEASTSSAPFPLYASEVSEDPTRPYAPERLPRWTSTFDYLPPSLAFVAEASVERDLVAAGLFGLVNGAAMVAAISWLLRNR